MMRRYEPKPWDIRRCDMIHADEGEYVLYCDAQTEIERLTKERDEARAQVAAAYKVAAKYLQSAADDWRSTNNELSARKIEDEIPGVLELTYADAQAALEAYGRSKVQEGMQRAAVMIQGNTPERIALRRAILAEMEKLK